MKGWLAVFSALLFFIPPGARAAEDLNGAARELARKSAALAGKGEPLSASWRNASSLGSTELSQARQAFEAAVRDAGGRISDVAPLAEARITLSENQSQFLLVEEVRKGEERQVWIASWKRSQPAPEAAPGILLDKKLVWEQDDQILDVAFPGTGMLILSPSKLTLYGREGGPWEARQAIPFAAPRPWPRDLRGRLRVNGSAFQVYLPGLTCSGAAEPAISMECRQGDEPWVLESGSRALLLASFAPARNYFDGRIVMQNGVRKTVASFFSAASVEEKGRQFWLLAMLDGRTQILDQGFEPAGSIGAWGSDIAGTEARCAGGSQVLATKAGEAREPDVIRAFAMINRVPTPLTAPVEFPGAVTALWTSGPASAIAVARDLATGRYLAYVLTVVCGS